MFSKIKIMLALTVLAFSGSAMALPLMTGEITISSGGNPVAPTGGATWDTATGVDFGANGAGDGAFVVDGASADFAAFASAGDVGVISDFSFSPFSGPVTPLWSVAGLEFHLLEITRVSQDGSIFPNYVYLEGKGILKGAGFEDTVGLWNFAGTGGRTTFGFSSTTVPEPESLAILGFALLAFGATSITRKRGNV